MPADYSTRSGADHAAKIRAGLAARKAQAEADCRLTDSSSAVLDLSAATVVLTGNTGAATLSLTGATSTGGITQVLCASGSADNLDTACITAIPVHTLS